MHPDIVTRPLWRRLAAPVSGAVLLIGASAGGALAHHSFSTFATGQTQTVQGVVKSLDLVNPHSWLQVMVTDAQGGASEWSLEMGAPSQLTRVGWSKTSVQSGDKVTVTLHPLRDGSHGGQLVSVVLPGGQTLDAGTPPGPPPAVREP